MSSTRVTDSKPKPQEGSLGFRRTPGSHAPANLDQNLNNIVSNLSRIYTKLSLLSDRLDSLEKKLDRFESKSLSQGTTLTASLSYLKERSDRQEKNNKTLIRKLDETHEQCTAAVQCEMLICRNVLAKEVSTYVRAVEDARTPGDVKYVEEHTTVFPFLSV